MKEVYEVYLPSSNIYPSFMFLTQQKLMIRSVRFRFRPSNHFFTLVYFLYIFYSIICVVLQTKLNLKLNFSLNQACMV